MSYVQSDHVRTPGGTAAGPRAGFWTRFGALVIDSIILGLVNGVLLAVLHATGYAIGIIVQAAYYTLLEGGPRGQTLGKSALGIRVISLEDGGPIGYARGFVRYIGRYVSTVVIFLGYLWMLWDSEKQCWHDKFAGDVVVPVSG